MVVDVNCSSGSRLKNFEGDRAELDFRDGKAFHRPAEEFLDNFDVHA